MKEKCRHVWKWDSTWIIPGGIKHPDGHIRLTDQIYRCACGCWMMSADYIDDAVLKSEKYVTV